MRLDRIEIKGFKSFRDKIEIEFPSKFTTIVGPNGSGKSNITEAVCFVLGRSRGLRAANLQELIFNGGKTGKAADKAVVTIRLKEEDGTPHNISRMVDVDGHSMYKIDGKRMTRQHIIDLVGDNEYNIILQDDVTKVIDMKPIERRQIIDELCGIAEYDKKKEKALKELEKVEERIGETHIILGEKQGYLNKLKRERDDALQYKQVSDELKQNRASLLNHDILLYKNRLGKYDEQVAEAEKEKGGLQEKINGLRGEIETKRAGLKDINNRIIDLEDGRSRSRYTELKEDIVRKEGFIQALTDKINEGTANAESNKKKIGGIKTEESIIESRLSEIDGEAKSLEKEITKEGVKVGDPKLEAKVDALKESVLRAKTQIESLDESIKSLEKKRETLAGGKAQYSGKLGDAADNLQVLKNKVEETKNALGGKSKEKEKLNSELASIEENLAKLQRELEEGQIEHARKKAELKTIEESWGGIHGAEKAVMRLKDVVPGIHGPVSQLGHVTKKEYETALLVAAGRRMHYIIVDNVDVAAKCIDYLKKKEIGRSTFLPVDKIKAETRKPLPKGAVGFARDYIKCEKKYDPIFEYVFGGTIVVEDVDKAKKIGVGENRMVTADGSLFELSGALTGGHIKKGVEVGFSNLEELEKEIEKLDAEIQTKTEERNRVVDRKDDVKKALIRLDPELAKLQSEAEEARIQLEKNRQISDNIKAEEDRITREGKSVEDEIKSKKSLKEKLAAEFNSTSRELEPLTAEKKKYDTSHLDQLKDKKRDLEIEAGRLRERLTTMRTQTKESESEIKSDSASQEKWREEIGGIEKELDVIRKELAVVERESATLVGEIRALINKRSDIEDGIQQVGVKIGEIEHEVNGVNERTSKIKIERAKVEAELETIEREFKKFEGVAIVERKVGELKAMVERLEKKLDEFGAINMKAIETYEAIKAEYDDITEKLETLKKERQSIFDFMEEVEQKKYETFMKTFEVVKTNFERIFHQLSDGEGTLILDNPKEISQSGLIIKASPGGKKIMSLDAMSGGEKVLTSAALLLAIQQYKPSFFYIVDELDAALDKSNSVRLAEMLRDSDAQFILVTHNNAMIQYAQTVVGVSMADGVSRIVGVKLDS